MSEGDAVVAAVEIDIAHGFPTDVSAEVVSPSGVTAQLFSGSEAISTHIDARRPDLAACAGETTRDGWTLRVYGTASADDGSLGAWASADTTGQDDERGARTSIPVLGDGRVPTPTSRWATAAPPVPNMSCPPAGIVRPMPLHARPDRCAP